MEKISYEHRVYESIDPNLGFISKFDGKNVSGSNGLTYFNSYKSSTYQDSFNYPVS